MRKRRVELITHDLRNDLLTCCRNEWWSEDVLWKAMLAYRYIKHIKHDIYITIWDDKTKVNKAEWEHYSKRSLAFESFLCVFHILPSLGHHMDFWYKNIILILTGYQNICCLKRGIWKFEIYCFAVNMIMNIILKNHL